MPSDNYSFLDVAVLDEVRQRFAAGDALAVLSTDLEQVIWANGPGAALLGYGDIEAILGAPAQLGAAARRQISATSGFPSIGRDRPLMVRLAAGVTSRAVAMLASAVAMPDGEMAILLSAPAEQENPARAISGFSETGHYVALLDGSAGIEAASLGFETLGISTESMSGLLARAGESRIVKRMIGGASGPLPAGLARLTDEPAHYLLVVIDENGAAEREVAEPSQPPAHTQENTEPLPRTGFVAEKEAEPIKTPAAPTEHDTWYFSSGPDSGAPKAEISAASDDAEMPGPTEPDQAEAEVEAGEIETERETEREREPVATGPATTEAPPAPKAIARPVIDRHSAPIRFVWRTDSQGRFSQISPEFLAAVGEDMPDIVGRRFEDVAAALGFDKSGEIAGLLDRRDTWSGRSVLWPVAGAGVRIPVDLAALPVYGRDRNFEGFRGFGVARIGDAIVDLEDARPLPVLSPDEAPTQGVDAAEPADPFRGETPALHIAPMPDRRFADKIIRLAEHRPPSGDRGGLSTGERIAFQQIAERLKRDSAPSAGGVKIGQPEETGAKAAPPAKDRIAGPLPPTEAIETPAEAKAPGDHEAHKAIEAAKPADREPASAEALPAAEAAQDEPAAEAEKPAEIAAGSPATVEPVTGAGKRPRPGMSLLDFAEWDREDAAENTGKAAGEIEADSAGPAMIAEDDKTAADEAASVVSDETVATSHAEAAADESEADVEAPPAQDSADEQEEPSTADATPPTPSLPAEQAAPSAPSSTDREAGGDTAILEKLPVPVLVHSGDVLHYANDEFLTLTGYDSIAQLSAAGGIGALFAETYEDEDQPDRLDRQLRLIKAKGEEFPVDAFLQSVPWNGGKALLLVLRRVEGFGPASSGQSPLIAELEARVAEMRTIIDTATDGVVLMTRDGTIRSISRPAEALFSFDSDEVAGKPFESLFAIESQRAARDYLNGLSDHGVASVLNDGREVIGRESRGRFIPLFMTIGRLPNDSGYCAVVRDITQWKRAEEDLTQARAVAERASSQKTDFLARVSHEIRTPLNAIIGFSELMVDERFGPVTNDRYRDYLRDINRSGNHVLDLVNDLLDISKIEAGQQEMDYEAVSLNDALAETVAMMQPQANRERVIIRSSFASKLPDVVADLRSVRQIALNILSNAVRYTQAGGQVIVSTAYEPAGEIVMRVRDTGIGMTQAEIEQAMKPFKQINSLKRARGDGTGLGLPLTKAMVEANRAKFVIHSTPGEGTLVEVTFPSTRVLAD